MGLPYDGRNDNFVRINQNQTPTPNQIAHQKFLDKKEKHKTQESDQKQPEPALDEEASSSNAKPRSK